MSVKQIIESYKSILKEDGIISKEELLGILKHDNDLVDKDIDKIADKILEVECKKAKEYSLTKVKKNERMELYRKGLNDVEIAEFQGVTQSTICQWRTRKKLPKNISKEQIEMENKKMELYKQGLSDVEIAEKLYLSRTAIRDWRLKYNLNNDNNRHPMKKGRSATNRNDQ